MVRLGDTPSVKESLQLLLQDMNGRIGICYRITFIGTETWSIEMNLLMNRSVSGHSNERYSLRRIEIHSFIDHRLFICSFSRPFIVVFE